MSQKFPILLGISAKSVLFEYARFWGFFLEWRVDFIMTVFLNKILSKCTVTEIAKRFVYLVTKH